MKTIAEVKTLADFLERAVCIAELAEHPNKNLAWMPTSTDRIQSALCHPAYPTHDSMSNAFREMWWKDHLRLRAMDVDSQKLVKEVTSWEEFLGNAPLMAAPLVAEILRKAATAANGG